jgi:hypothetical protein
MTRAILAAAFCAALTACAAASGNKVGNLTIRDVKLPALAAPAPAPAPAVQPPPCPADLMADLQERPTVPANAGFPAAETPEAAAQVQAYSVWLASFGHHDAEGWRRAALAKAFCEGKR